MLKYVSPVYLLTIFAFWAWKNLPDRWHAIVTPPEDGPPVVLFSVLLILAVGAFFTLIVGIANKAWDKEEKPS